MAEKKIHVLLTEDNQDLQAIYRAALEAAGFSVASAFNGREAFDRIREHRPDLILLDIVMPTMDGLEFLRRRAKVAEAADVPVIVMTNLGQDEDRKLCERLGVKSFLNKTEVSIESLPGILRSVLGMA